MNNEDVVKRFVQYRSLIGKAGIITRATSLALIMPYGVFTANIGVVLAGLTLYTLGNEARNLHTWLRPDNMLDSVMQNMGDLFDD